MSLHNDVMNLPCVLPEAATNHAVKLAFKMGHKQARHAAAELALSYDKRIEELETALKASQGLVDKLVWESPYELKTVLMDAKDYILHSYAYSFEQEAAMVEGIDKLLGAM